MIGGIDLVALVATLMVAAVPVLFAALGELVVERAGVLNLGVEGMMIMGAVAGFGAAVATGSALLGFGAAALAGAALAALFALLTQVLMANQTASGLALTLFGLGLSALVGQGYAGMKAPVASVAELSLLQRLLTAQYAMIALGLCATLAIWWFLTRSHAGLVLRAVGENHAAAHALGYRVRRIRLLALLFGGAMAGLGGAYLSLVRVPQWTEGMTSGAGWIALAIVVFASWRAERVLLGAYLFSGVGAAQLAAQAAGYQVPVHLLAMAPYLITILALVLISAPRGGGTSAPADLGKPFHPSA